MPSSLKKTTFTNLMSLFITAIYLSNYSLHWSSKNLGIYCYLLSLIVGVRSPRLGFYSLICLLPWTGSLPEQIRHFFHLPIKPIYHLGLDFTAGWISGCFLHRVRSQANVSFDKLPNQKIIKIFCFYLIFACIIGILRNFWQSATIPALKGIFYHLLSWRTLSWQDDLYPWKELIYFMTAIGALNTAFHVIEKANVKLLARCFALSTILLSSFALSQWLFQIGWSRDPFSRGVNSFFQDLHAFAGYILASFVFLSIYIKQSKDLNTRILYLSAMGLGIGALLASGSRASVIFLVMYILIYAIYYSFKIRSRIYLILLILSSIPILSGTAYYLSKKGITIQKLQYVTSDPDFTAVNRVLSYRPEIFNAAIHMISDYPIFGLGLGEFNRTSAIENYSTSRFLIKKGGENAHNYFLQLTADTGFLGLALFFIVLLSPARHLPTNQRIPFIGLMGGIALGNLYSHSLLEREMLMLTFLSAGFFSVPMKYHSNNFRPIHSNRILQQWSIVVLLSIFILSGKLLGDKPFTYGLKCYKQNLAYKDGWMSGTFIKAVPQGTKRIVISLQSGDPTVHVVPLGVAIEIKDQNPDQSYIVASKTIAIDSRNKKQLEIHLPQTNTDSDLIINLETSRCFVPRNNGRTNDQRHLSLQVLQLQFL